MTKGKKAHTVTIGVRVSEEELARMKSAAERDGRNLSNWIRFTVVHALSVKAAQDSEEQP